VRLCIAVLEGSSVDEQLEVHNDLCADEIPVVLFLVELMELVLKDLFEIAAVTRVWNDKVVVLRRAG
jgi:hypothetical protein